MNTYSVYYDSLIKPFFSPPTWVFGVAWGIIYPLIFISFVYLLYLIYKNRAPKKLLWIFILNMIGNLSFTSVQFGLQNNILSSAVILFVLLTLLSFECKIRKYSMIIFWLMMPYLLWGAFATILQITITILNL